MPIDILFDFAAVHLDGDKADETDIRIDFAFTDLDQTWTSGSSVAYSTPGWVPRRKPSSPCRGPKSALVGVVLTTWRRGTIRRWRHISSTGDRAVLAEFAGVIDEFDPNFTIVTP